MNNKIFFATVRNTYKSFLTLLVCAAVLGSQFFIGGVTTSVAQGKPKIDFNAKISGFKTRAGQYNSVANQIRSLSSKSFNSKQDVQSAVSTLSKNRSVLERNIHHSLVDIVLKNAAFKRAVEAEAEKVGAGRLIKEINANPNRVASIAGASQVRAEMKSSLALLAKDYEKLGNNLNSAKSRLQFLPAGGQSINLFETSSGSAILTTASYRMFTPEPKRTGEINYNPVKMLRTAYGHSNEFSEPNGAVAEPVTITAALIAGVVLIIGAWAIVKVDDIQDKEIPPGAEPDYDSRSDFKVCTDNAQARLDTCLQQKEGDFWGESGCWAAYALKMAECIVLPQ